MPPERPALHPRHLIDGCLRPLHALGYWLWCWTDAHMGDDVRRKG